jgi:hypothetical protein
MHGARDSGAWSLLSARMRAEAISWQASRSFSSKAVDIDSLDVKELRAMIGELQERLQAAEGRKEVGSTGDSSMVITGAPESMMRATKGEVHEENLKCITVVELQKMRDKGAPIAMVKKPPVSAKNPALSFQQDTHAHIHHSTKCTQNVKQIHARAPPPHLLPA